MKTNFLGTSFILFIIAVVPSCLSLDEDELNDGDSADELSNDAILENRIDDDQRIIVSFALYGNLTKDSNKHHRFGELPRKIKEFRSSHFIVNNTLSNTFNVFNYTEHGGFWWNGRQGASSTRWVYDDASPDHLLVGDHSHNGTRFFNGDQDEIRFASMHHRPGIIYMAYSNGFRSFGALLASNVMTYLYEVYGDSDDEDRLAFHEWNRIFDNHQRVNTTLAPIFDISDLSSATTLVHGKHVLCKDATGHHPSWPKTQAQIERSTDKRMQGLQDIHIGFYSGCNIDHNDVKPLLDELESLRSRVKN